MNPSSAPASALKYANGEVVEDHRDTDIEYDCRNIEQAAGDLIISAVEGQLFQNGVDEADVDIAVNDVRFLTILNVHRLLYDSHLLIIYYIYYKIVKL